MKGLGKIVAILRGFLRHNALPFVSYVFPAPYLAA